MRERLIHERTAKSNQIKSTVAEEDFIFPVDLIQLRQAIVALVNSSDVRMTLLLRRPGSMYFEQLMALPQWVDELNIEQGRKHP
jgi:transposase